MKFGELVKKSKADLTIGGRHDAWLKQNANPSYSQEALDFCMRELAKQPRDRRGTVSASSLGSCRRRQSFTFLGLPQIPPTPKLAQVFQNGTMMHLRWQMAGLTEGWLVAAEVPVGENHLNLSGTQDGIAYDGSIVEFKSINSHGFSAVNTFGVKEDHRFQVGTYMVATGQSRSVMVYENKDTQEYVEIPVEMDDQLYEDVHAISAEIWEYLELEELPEPLSECEDKQGWRYNSCPFREQCLKIKDWNHAKEIAG